MKNIGIITLNDNSNYGNRLQNYALTKILNKYSCDVFTLVKKSYTDFFKQYIKLLFPINRFLRSNNFYRFNKNIKFKYVNSFDDDDFFDYYFVGSDQVWNPKFALKDEMLLMNINCEKRVSYSASIGLYDIDNNSKNKIKNEVSKFKYISVREERARELICEITNRNDVEVLIDPTLLLTSEEWNKVIKKPKMLKSKKYILNYFLGNLSSDKKKEISRIAKEYDCDIINILDKNSPFYSCGPSEFLYLEKNAFLICTDSFHSSVFAFLFDVPFIIFDRDEKGMNNMGSRLDTFLSTFELNDRRFNGIEILKENLEHNYNNGYYLLEKERKKSFVFLSKVINDGEKDYEK